MPKSEIEKERQLGKQGYQVWGMWTWRRAMDKARDARRGGYSTRVLKTEEGWKVFLKRKDEKKPSKAKPKNKRVRRDITLTTSRTRGLF